MLCTSEAKITQSCLTLCKPMDYRVHGILQARILEWIAFPFSKGSSQPRDWTRVSCIAGRFFTNRTMREALIKVIQSYTLIKVIQSKLRLFVCLSYYLFIWLRCVLVATHKIFVVLCWHSGSGVVVHGIGCSTAYGILVPQSGIKPVPLAMQGRFLTTGPPGKFVCTYF